MKRVESPWKSHYFIEKFERKKWLKAIIDRQIPDFCGSIDNQKEPWVYVTTHIKKKNCPFEAGHVEVFEHAEIKRIPDYIPFTVS